MCTRFDEEWLSTEEQTGWPTFILCWTLQACRLVPAPTMVRVIAQVQMVGGGKNFECSTSIWLRRRGSAALRKRKKKSHFSATCTLSCRTRRMILRKRFIEHIIVCFILENKKGRLDLIMAFCFKDCNASFWYGAFQLFFSMKGFYCMLLLAVAAGLHVVGWESDVENQTKDLSASGVARMDVVGVKSGILFSLLRTSNLGTQKASPLGLSRHFVLPNFYEVDFPSISFFFKEKKQTKTNVSFHALRCYDSGVCGSAISASAFACRAPCHRAIPHPPQPPAVLSHGTQNFTFPAL